jgi:hypothetical protein
MDSPDRFAHLAEDEGTIKFTYTFEQPPSGPPAEPVTILRQWSEELRAYLTLLPDGTLRWRRVRGADDGGYVELDVSELIGAKSWMVFLLWSPAGPALAVGAGGELLESPRP